MKPTARACQVAGPRCNYAIIDEVDSILIDEARTPLIISGPAFDDVRKYAEADRIARLLKQDDALRGQGEGTHLPPDRRGHPRGRGIAGLESFYTAGNMDWPHLIDNCLQGPSPLQARQRLRRPMNGEIIIVDEFTGRLMTGRQWSDGLHQAVEAKEQASRSRKRTRRWPRSRSRTSSSSTRSSPA